MVDAENAPVAEQDNILETLIQYIGEFESVEDCINWIQEDNQEALAQLDSEKKKVLL
jgi:hypothetical protein